MNSTDSLIMVQLLTVEVVVACEGRVACEGHVKIDPDEVERYVSVVDRESALLALELLMTDDGCAEEMPKIVLAVVMNVVRDD